MNTQLESLLELGEVLLEIDGLFLLINTVGGDCSCGLAAAEMIASIKKPTVSLVIGDSHSIGVPLSVAADRTFIAPTATMILHPVRLNGTIIGAPQTFEYFRLIQDRIVTFVEAHTGGFYDEVRGGLAGLLHNSLKTSTSLKYAMLTGIQRVAKENIFSDLNNLDVYTVIDNDYSEYFGFSIEETKELLEYYDLELNDEVKEMYDGYKMGDKEIYNPWSVINYISKGCIPQAYWVNTGKNEIFEEIMNAATDDIVEKLHILLQGEIVIARIDQNVVYRSLAEDPANIYSLLLVAGYLKTQKKDLQADGSYLCEVTIPNKEIASVYKSEILSHFLQKGIITRTTANKIAESLYANDHKKLQSAVAEYLDKSISFYDGGAEGFYHGLMLGLIALMDNQYKIKSNRESGDGRYDICMIPREKRYPGILFELKWEKNLEEEDLNLLAEEALQQITTLKYDADMREDGITDILRFGIAFSGKKVRVKTII